MQKQKRERDAFDVYLMLLQTNRQDTINRLAAMSKQGRQYETVFQKGINYIDEHVTEFDQRVKKHLKMDPQESPAKIVRDALSESIELANSSNDTLKQD